MIELEEFYEKMPKELREYFFDSRIFPSMTFLGDDPRKFKMFNEKKSKLRERFNFCSEEYKIGLEYLTRLFRIGDSGK